MNAGSFIGMSLLSSFIVNVGLPMALGVFFRGFLKKSNPAVPAFMAASVLFSVQQFVVYRGDQRMSTVLPRVQSLITESWRYEEWVTGVLFVVLMAAGVGIPFVFARLGISVSDFVDQTIMKVKNFIGRFLPGKHE